MGPGLRPRMLDGFLPKIEEWVDRSSGKVRADVVHERLVAQGFTGTERTTRRAVARAKAAWRAGHRRTYRPWITEPGLWLQFDWGEGPKVPGPDGTPRRTWLFCAWLAFLRFRVVIPVWDQTLPTLITCLDATLHRLGGVPTYVLTDNPRTVSIDHVAGVPVRHPQIVEVGRHYGMQVHTCVPFDPESKGGTEATVKIAKADLVPTDANLRADYASFAELDRLRDVHPQGQRPQASRVRTDPGRGPGRGTCPPARAARGSSHDGAGPDPVGGHRSDGAGLWIGARPRRRAWSGPRLGSAPRGWSRRTHFLADLDALPTLPDWAGDRRGLVEVARHRLSTRALPGSTWPTIPTTIPRTRPALPAFRGPGPAPAPSGTSSPWRRRGPG